MDSPDVDDERREELETLQSIYPELRIDPENPFVAHISLIIEPITAVPVTFEPDQEVHRLAHLPPINLELSLPAGYPAEVPPSVKVTTSPSWLPSATIDRLVEHATSLWDEYGRSQILFTYVSYIQEEAETAFGLSALTLPSGLSAELVAYSTKMKQDVFDKQTFECEVCLDPKRGSACYRMQRCNHVFCVSCLQDYYGNCIKEGDVNSVKCMSTECGNSTNSKKKDRLISPKELLRIPLPLETVERYANIKRKKKMEADPDMVYCPRSWCQGAMRSTKYPKITDVSQMDESDSEDDEPAAPLPEPQSTDGIERRRIGAAGSNRLAICEDCKLAFCQICLASWHGDYMRCEPRDSSELTEEDQASLNFIMKNCSPCPTCAVPCQKSYGCNHMTCFQCKTHFCYLCGAWLSPDHPYQHFQNPKNKACFNRLMDMVEGDLAQQDMQFGGRRGAEQIADFWEEQARLIEIQLNAEDH